MPPRTHARPLMIELELLSVPDLYILRVCAEMHGYIYQRKAINRPENNHTYVSTAQMHEYPTRHSKQLHYYIPNRRENPKCTMQHYTRKYTEIWNAIPLETKEIQTLETFKTQTPLCDRLTSVSYRARLRITKHGQMKRSGLWSGYVTIGTSLWNLQWTGY